MNIVEVLELLSADVSGVTNLVGMSDTAYTYQKQCAEHMNQGESGSTLPAG